MSELNTTVRRRNFLKSYQEYLLKTGAHLLTTIQHKLVCAGTHLQHEIEDNRLQSMRKNIINRKRLGGLSSGQDLGEYFHHETEDNRLQPVNKNILSSRQFNRERRETEDNRLQPMNKNILSSRQFNREPEP